VCDQDHLARMDGKAGRRRETGGVSRREFAALGALATAAALAPAGGAAAQAGGRDESTVSFDVPGGRMDGFFVHPVQGKHPAVIVWPDIAGLRDAFMSMSRRLATQGYAVLVLNPYFADEEAPQFDDFDDWREQGGMEKVAPWREKLTAASVMEVAKAVVAYLDGEEAVDTARGIGVQGYCMGGPFAVWTAAAVPERVKAAASFHGGRLVGDEETSPVKMIGQTQANFLFAIARDDDRNAPGDKTALKAAADAAGRPAEVRVYRGDHGWTVADSPAYNYDEDDASWEKLLDLYEAAL
jgi:carboxymethylenebutenolidase